MKIAIYIEQLSTDRGMWRYTSKLFYTMKILYPHIDIYIINASKDDINFPFEYTQIQGTLSDFITHGIQFVIFFCNGHGAENFNYNFPNLQAVSIIHDVIDITHDKNNEHETGIVSEKNVHMKKIYQQRVSNSNLVFTVSEYSKNDILKYLDIKPSHLLEVIYPAPMLKIEQGYEKNNIISEPYFLYNGGFCYRKGVLQLIYNFIDLKLKNKLKSKLVITGKNYLKDNTILNSLLEYGIQKGYIIDMGYVSDKILVSLYKNAVAMVYPSSYEGFGIPLVEAMNIGCPIITCDNTSISEVCGKNTAYYINKWDSEDFQRALMLFESKQFIPQKEKLIKNAYENVKKFSWIDSANKFYKALKDNENNYTNKLKKLNSLIYEINNVIDNLKEIEVKLNERNM